MPIYTVEYNSEKDRLKRILVKAPCLADAALTFSQRRAATVDSVYLAGKIMNSPAAALEPTWTSKNGKTKKLSKIKTNNLRAIFAKLSNSTLTGSGIYTAVRDELDKRSCAASVEV